MEHRSDASGPKGRVSKPAPTTPNSTLSRVTIMLSNHQRGIGVNTASRKISLALVALMLTGTLIAPALADDPEPLPTDSAWGVKVIVPEVVSIVPHDPTAFTQGLEIHNGKFYESTGLYGESSVRIVNMTTGEVELQYDLPDEYFGEGLTIWNDSVVQLTWRENTGFIYDLETLEPRGEFTYMGEGWGLCSDGDDNLWISDGGSTLKRFSQDLSSFEEEEVEVRVDGLVTDKWNELECPSNYPFLANRWYEDNVYRINTETGIVCHKVDFSAIREQFETEDSGVLNGIARDHAGGGWWVTGKNWSNYYQVNIPWGDFDPSSCEEEPSIECEALVLQCGVSYWRATDGFAQDLEFFSVYAFFFLLIVLPPWYMWKRQTEKPPLTSEDKQEGGQHV